MTMDDFGCCIKKEGAPIKYDKKSRREQVYGTGCYPHTAFCDLVDETFRTVMTLATLKGGEYSGDKDRLANFRRNAANLGLTKEQVWSVYAGKHWDAINQYVRDKAHGIDRERLEDISGRADDLIVYLLLFKAMVEEHG